VRAARGRPNQRMYGEEPGEVRHPTKKRVNHRTSEQQAAAQSAAMPPGCNGSSAREGGRKVPGR